MGGYNDFAAFYDLLTNNISYRECAGYFDKLVKLHGGNDRGILLDLACGTGSLSEEMCRLGYDVIGVDSSEKMLNIALDKKHKSGLDIQYIFQDMAKLDMFGTADVTICALDSLNHLNDLEETEETISRVSLFCEKGGLFIFDMNTPYKHKNILGNNTFVYDIENLYCVWQNSYSTKDNRVLIELDIFEKQRNGSYKRFWESFSETAYDIEITDSILIKHGFEICGKYNYMTFDKYKDGDEKMVYVAKKLI